MRRIVTAVAIGSMFLMSLLALSAGSALADPGNGAVQDPTNGPVNYNQCIDQGETTLCTVIEGEEHAVATGSGGYNVQMNFRTQCYTVTDNATGIVLTSNCTSGHYQFHFDKTGDSQIYSMNVVVSNSSVNGTTDCFSTVFHYANGQVQYDHSSDTC